MNKVLTRSIPILIILLALTTSLIAQSNSAQQFMNDLVGRWTFNNPNNLPESEIGNENNIYSNYPNPFNPTTTIQFDLKETSIITLMVYNYLDEVAVELENKKNNAGSYTIIFDA